MNGLLAATISVDNKFNGRDKKDTAFWCVNLWANDNQIYDEMIEM